ncbi:hypothetical protein [Kitasatospora sp. NBC_01266]|uniref:hypothetical protein n=1 Tax=Kitasatospora sp. NBC_01266 TaxID=2903572 RepID=UPI002E315607|nr:hypothetical protein [Kitasatospora sp. NBC_01266]
MRVHVAYEQDGRIVALAEIEDQPAGNMVIRPVAGGGRSVVEAEVPTEYADFSLAGLIDRLRVDTGAATPTLIAR